MESKHSNAHSSASPWQSGALAVAGLLMRQRGVCPASPAERGLPGNAGAAAVPRPAFPLLSADPAAPFVNGKGCSRSEGRPALFVLPHRVPTGYGRSFRLAGPSSPRSKRQRRKRGRTTSRSYNVFGVPGSSDCAELRVQRSPSSPQATGTALHFPHPCGPAPGLRR